MKRAREADDGENIPACIVVLKEHHSNFGCEGHQQHSHGDGPPFCVISDFNSSPENLKASSCTAATATNSSKWTQPATCSGTEFSEALVFDKPENTAHGDDGKPGADPKKEPRKKDKRKKHRPKVVEIEKPERKAKMEIPMPPQTPKQKTPAKKKGKVIGRRTFARKKTVTNSLDDKDEWEEVGDQPNPTSTDQAINPSFIIQMDRDELDANMNVESWGSELIAENLPEEDTNSSADVNIRIDELLQELSKLPAKSSSPPLLKAELLQLNIKGPIDTLSYIVDNIRIPSLLYFIKKSRRSMAGNRTTEEHKLVGGLNHSVSKVLEEFLYVLKNLLPSLLLRNDQSKAAEHMFNNRKGRTSRRNTSGSKEPRAMAKRASILAAHSNFQIVPYTHLDELSSRFQHIDASCTIPVACNFPTNAQISKNGEYVNSTPNQGSNNSMELALQSVVDNFRFLNINKGCRVDAPIESQNALVPFVGGGMIVPYNRLFEQVKKKPHKAQVLLDPETNRVWKFLQDNEGDENVEGMDSCKLAWWENERRVFLGRANSFIARMNLILGDRRFSPWKGSIVDSVVGVFLTQNVSDHLSSSAFMSLAAKFPPHRRGDEGGSSARKPSQEHEETSTDSMTCKNDIPGLSNCDDQDPMDIQLDGHLLEDLESQSYHLQTSLGSIRLVSENSMKIDVDGCFPKHVANDSKAPGEFVQNECRDLPHVLSESVACESLNSNSFDTMDVEKEAATGFSNEVKAHFMLEKNTSRAKKSNTVDEGKIDWEGMRRKVDHDGLKERSYESLDSANWEAVQNADVNKISEAIRERGMNNLLAERIKDFLDRLVRDHGRVDLEWLRNICPDDTKKYLLSIRGLGLKSVECVRLLALQNVAFPVDTNVARISVRLGWVPLKPLPEFLQLHLLEQYPIMDSVQKYIWPRLCKLDQKQLYELHYHMITFGKVFCTKSRPNCNICPMRGECKHFNSAKLALPAPEDKQLKASSFPDTHLRGCNSFYPVPQLQYNDSHVSGVLHDSFDPIIEYPPTPIIDEPPPLSPDETLQILDADIEDAFYEDDEIPTIKLNLEQFGQNLQNLMQINDVKIPDNDISEALVELSAEASSIPNCKLKNISGLRTEHHVYELPDSHLLLEEMDQREPDDPSPYLLAIWTPGETAQSTELPESCCKTQEFGILCEEETCFSCNSRRELNAQTVRGTILIPCRTAMRGRFPLNGTYFQINEVFADHDSSRTPIHVPRSCIWNLPRRTVYFGTSIAAIFRGFIATEPIQYCFSRGFVCVRGFDRKRKEPKPLYARLHLPRSKAPNNKKPWARREE